MAYATLLAANSALCHPWITALQFHGALLPSILVAVLWLVAGYARLRELRRLRSVSHKRAVSGSIPKHVASAAKLAPEEVRPVTAVN
jgi:hypothetical protein